MKRQTLILATLFGLLLIAAYSVLQSPGERSTTAGGTAPLFDVDSSAVDRVDLHSPNGAVVLVRKGNDWFLEQPLAFTADKNNVASLLQQVKNLTVKSVVSTRADKHSLFQVDSVAGTSVTVYQNSVPFASFIVGKTSSSFGETYIRKEGSDDVLLADGSLTWYFNKPVRDWRSRVIFSSPRDLIREVGFRYGDTTFTLAFRDSVWMVGSNPAKESEVNNLLSTLTSFVADDFVDTPPVPAPRFTARVTCNDVELRFAFNNAENKYWVQTSGSPQWYAAGSWNVNQLLKRRNDLVQR